MSMRKTTEWRKSREKLNEFKKVTMDIQMLVSSNNRENRKERDKKEREESDIARVEERERRE